MSEVGPISTTTRPLTIKVHKILGSPLDHTCKVSFLDENTYCYFDDSTMFVEELDGKLINSFTTPFPISDIATVLEKNLIMAIFAPSVTNGRLNEKCSMNQLLLIDIADNSSSVHRVTSRNNRLMNLSVSSDGLYLALLTANNSVEVYRTPRNGKDVMRLLITKQYRTTSKKIAIGLAVNDEQDVCVYGHGSMLLIFKKRKHDLIELDANVVLSDADPNAAGSVLSAAWWDTNTLIYGTSTGYLQCLNLHTKQTRQISRQQQDNMGIADIQLSTAGVYARIGQTRIEFYQFNAVLRQIEFYNCFVADDSELTHHRRFKQLSVSPSGTKILIMLSESNTLVQLNNSMVRSKIVQRADSDIVLVKTSIRDHQQMMMTTNNEPCLLTFDSRNGVHIHDFLHSRCKSVTTELVPTGCALNPFYSIFALCDVQGFSIYLIQHSSDPRLVVRYPLREASLACFYKTSNLLCVVTSGCVIGVYDIFKRDQLFKIDLGKFGANEHLIQMDTTYSGRFVVARSKTSIFFWSPVGMALSVINPLQNISCDICCVANDSVLYGTSEGEVVITDHAGSSIIVFASDRNCTVKCIAYQLERGIALIGFSNGRIIVGDPRDVRKRHTAIDTSLATTALSTNAFSDLLVCTGNSSQYIAVSNGKSVVIVYEFDDGPEAMMCRFVDCQFVPVSVLETTCHVSKMLSPEIRSMTDELEVLDCDVSSYTKRIRALIRSITTSHHSALVEATRNTCMYTPPAVSVDHCSHESERDFNRLKEACEEINKCIDASLEAVMLVDRKKPTTKLRKSIDQERSSIAIPGQKPKGSSTGKSLVVFDSASLNGEASLVDVRAGFAKRVQDLKQCLDKIHRYMQSEKTRCINTLVDVIKVARQRELKLLADHQVEMNEKFTGIEMLTETGPIIDRANRMIEEPLEDTIQMKKNMEQYIAITTNGESTREQEAAIHRVLNFRHVSSDKIKIGSEFKDIEVVFRELLYIRSAYFWVIRNMMACSIKTEENCCRVKGETTGMDQTYREKTKVLQLKRTNVETLKDELSAMQKTLVYARQSCEKEHRHLQRLRYDFVNWLSGDRLLITNLKSLHRYRHGRRKIEDLTGEKLLGESFAIAFKSVGFSKQKARLLNILRESQSRIAKEYRQLARSINLTVEKSLVMQRQMEFLIFACDKRKADNSKEPLQDIMKKTVSSEPSVVKLAELQKILKDVRERVKQKRDIVAQLIDTDTNKDQHDLQCCSTSRLNSTISDRSADNDGVQQPLDERPDMKDARISFMMSDSFDYDERIV